ncbi:MAG: hypothetical protein QXN37_04415 [Candidatus Anstonellaceae archaeon]
MSEEVKLQILAAWNRYTAEHIRRYKKNEGSSAQHEEYCRIFRDGILKHPKLSKKEKEELLIKIGFFPPPA